MDLALSREVNQKGQRNHAILRFYSSADSRRAFVSNGERCALSTGNLPWGGVPRNNVDRITDRPDTTSAVYRVHKASIQTNKP